MSQRVLKTSWWTSFQLTAGRGRHAFVLQAVASVDFSFPAHDIMASCLHEPFPPPSVPAHAFATSPSVDRGLLRLHLTYYLCGLQPDAVSDFFFLKFFLFLLLLWANNQLFH